MGCKVHVVNIGGVYGGWEVQSFAGSHPKTHKRMYLCLCTTCGITALRAASKIKTGLSAGCMRCSRITHGLSGSHLYNVAIGVQQRCLNPDSISYPHYGGRGITLYLDWHGPEGAVRMAKWLEDNLPPWQSGQQLDRIDNNRGYEPGNLRWVTCTENNNNRRSNRRIEWGGRIQNLKQWARELGISRDTLAWRLDSGWDLDRAMTQSVGKNGRRGSKKLKEAA